MARSGRPLKVESELQYIDNYVTENDINGIKELIKQHGVNCYDPDKRTLLIIAAAKGNRDVLELMIALGSDVNFQDRTGYSALHFASQNRLIDIAKLLVENGANFNIIDLYGNPPLWTAIFNSKGNIEVVKYLLDSGADMNIKNNSGKSPKEIGEIMLKNKFKELIKGN